MNYFSIFFYILGGFFVYSFCLMAFTNVPDLHIKKFVMLGVIALLGLVSFLIAHTLKTFKHWQRYIGISIICGVCVTAMVVVSLFSIILTPEIGKYVQTDSLQFFNDYLTGISLSLCLLILGVLLVKKD